MCCFKSQLKLKMMHGSWSALHISAITGKDPQKCGHDGSTVKVGVNKAVAFLIPILNS